MNPTKIILLCSLFAVVYGSTCLGNYKIGSWVNAKSGAVPTGAVAGGRDKSDTLYICRTHGVNGKLLPREKKCLYTWRGKEKKASPYEVLTDVDGVWVPISGIELPCNRLEMVLGEVSREPSYSIRYYNKGGTTPLTIGKYDVYPYYGYGGKEHKIGVNSVYEMFTAVPNLIFLQKIYPSAIYYLNGSYLTFRVRSFKEVSISFGQDYQMKYRVTLGLHENTVVAIGTEASPLLKVAQLPNNVVNGYVSSPFWIRVTASTNSIELGREGDLTPVVSFTDSGVSRVNSVRFTSADQSTWNIPAFYVLGQYN